MGEVDYEHVEAKARESLREWDITPTELTLISHTENIVYRVDTGDGTPYAFRVHRPGYHTFAELNSEPAWTRALNEFGIAAPNPVPTRAGDDYTTIDLPGTGEGRFVGLVQWLDGVPLKDHINSAPDGPSRAFHYEQLGALIAKMHNQAVAWTPPADFRRHSFNKEGFLGETPFWGRFWEIPELSDAQRSTIIATRDWMDDQLASFETTTENFSMIHGDLGPANVLLHEGRLQVIDFDDAGFGWHLYDIAVALYQASLREHYDATCDALIEGYRSQRTISEDDLARLPQFNLMRSLALIGWLHDRPENDFYQYLSQMIDAACEKADRIL